MTRATIEQQEPEEQAVTSRRPSLSMMILLGLVTGIAAGLFFGEFCARLDIVGRAFIGLLRMTVLPYIIVSLIANLGRLSLPQSRRLAVVGGAVLLILWLIALISIVLLPQSLPQWKAGSFFSSTLAQPAPTVDLVDIFIPSNVFAALSHGQVPAVVLLCMFTGLALAGLDNRHVVIDLLDVLAKVLIRISTLIVRLAPIGVFAMAASTAGTISLSEVGRLQAYLVVYTVGAVFLTFVVLPLLITSCTPFTYRDALDVSKDSLITAFATGKLIIVLPLLIEQTEQLFARHRQQSGDTAAPAVDALYPIAYSFPHVGKLLGMLFIPFAAWFLGNALHWDEYPRFLVAGLFSYFGGPVLATPYLLDQMHLPHDMFQLFMLSGVWCERFGDAVGVMHLVAFTIVTTCAFTGRLRLRWFALVRYFAVMTLLSIVLIVVMRISLSRSLTHVELQNDVIAQMRLLAQPVTAEVLSRAEANPVPLQQGEKLLQRIRRRGIIRVGYNADALPFAYFNTYGELVGFDIDLAHTLARDLDVTIEFVPFAYPTLAEQLEHDDFDVVMSGLVGTLERAEAMQHTSPYMDSTLSLVVQDFRAREFRSLESMQAIPHLRLAYVDLSAGFVARLHKVFPLAELIELRTNQQFFDDSQEDFDALLIGAESGSAFTLIHPDYEVVLPDDISIALPHFYAVAARDAEMRGFLEYWVTLRKQDGTMQENYDHWILGKNPQQQKPRWSVLRDVLGWVP